MVFKPLGNRVLIEREEESNTTLSGIIIPDSSKVKPLNGKVLSIGSEVEGVEVGDVVVFAKYTGTEIVVEGNEYLILSVDDILGLLK
jgi:chaperonin GroES